MTNSEKTFLLETDPEGSIVQCLDFETIHSAEAELVPGDHRAISIKQSLRKNSVKVKCIDEDGEPCVGSVKVTLKGQPSHDSRWHQISNKLRNMEGEQINFQNDLNNLRERLVRLERAEV